MTNREWLESLSDEEMAKVCTLDYYQDAPWCMDSDMKISKAKLTRELLENYVGKKIKVVLFDNSCYEGILELGNGFFYEPKKYVVGNVCFRLSHIKWIKEL